jgi:hypothetical protein
MSAPATKRTRTVKSPQQKAQEALEAANVRLEKASKALTDAAAAMEAASAEYARAEQIAVYAAQHPDLPQSDSSSGLGDFATSAQKLAKALRDG